MTDFWTGRSVILLYGSLLWNDPAQMPPAKIVLKFLYRGGLPAPVFPTATLGTVSCAGGAATLPVTVSGDWTLVDGTIKYLNGTLIGGYSNYESYGSNGLLFHLPPTNGQTLVAEVFVVDTQGSMAYRKAGEVRYSCG